MVERDWKKPNRWIGWLGKTRAMDRLAGKSGGAKALACWSGKARAVGQLVGKGQGGWSVGRERPRGSGVGQLVGEGQGGGAVGRERLEPVFSSSPSNLPSMTQ